MRRALVIGAETHGLAGADNDARDVAAWLAGHGFSVDLRAGRAASRDAIREGLVALVADVRDGDAAVVYYSGHGGLLEVTGGAPAHLGYLVPTDHERGGPFRGITALEWSAQIAALTARTRNVAVIHDCCHAAHTVRAPGRPRSIELCRAAPSEVRAAMALPPGAAVHPLGNPDAVRLVAAAGRGLAWEIAGAGGRVRGVFTSSLLAEADELGARAVSWGELGRRARERVLRVHGRQRPELEGPTGRRVFGVDVLCEAVRIPVRPEGRSFVLAAGRVHGVERDDVLPAAGPAQQLAVVTQVGVLESLVRVQMEPGAPRRFEVAAPERGPRAAAQALRRLAEELGAPGELTMGVERVGAAPARLADGDEIAPADRLCVHLANHTRRTLWLHVFAVGPAARVEALGPVSSGAQLEPGATEILGAVPGLGAIGFTLGPPAIAAGAAEEEAVAELELIAIATTAPVDLSIFLARLPSERSAGHAEERGALAPSDRMEAPEPGRDLRSGPIAHRAIAARRRLVLRPERSSQPSEGGSCAPPVATGADSTARALGA